MKKLSLAAIAATAALSLAGTASAQIIGVATTKGGATAQVSNAIAKVVSLKSDFEVRTQVMGGTQQYIPVVNAGEVDFGLSNLPQYTMAKTGTGLSAGTKYDNLRIAATMMVFRVGPIVARSSGINKLSELRVAAVQFHPRFVSGQWRAQHRRHEKSAGGCATSALECF